MSKLNLDDVSIHNKDVRYALEYESLSSKILLGSSNHSDDSTSNGDDVLVLDNRRFSSTSLLGRGTFGVVWKGYDVILKKEVAIKKFKSISSAKSATLLDIEYDKDLSSGILLLIMELEVMDLEKWMNLHRDDMCLRDCKKYTRQILQGCEYLHSQHVIHRDIKPDNVLMDPRTETLKLSDFGMSRLFSKGNERGRVPASAITNSYPVQALWYRAPEVLLGCAYYTESIDVWAIGCIMSELLNHGQLVFCSHDCSSIDQLHKIFQVFGTPDATLWPALVHSAYFRDSFPVWPRRDLGRLFEPGVDRSALQLLETLLVPDPTLRTSCASALKSAFFCT